MTVVPLVGRLVETADLAEPWRLVDPAGEPVPAVSAYFQELQAVGRSPLTLRSYGLDLLRWFRFLWALELCWDRATRAEARDFTRWLRLAGKPPRPHGRSAHDTPSPVTNSGQAYAVSVQAHSETVLRGFYDFHREAEGGAGVEPVPAGPFAAAPAGACAPQSDGAGSQRADRPV